MTHTSKTSHVTQISVDHHRFVVVFLTLDTLDREAVREFFHHFQHQKQFSFAAILGWDVDVAPCGISIV